MFASWSAIACEATLPSSSLCHAGCIVSAVETTSVVSPPKSPRRHPPPAHFAEHANARAETLPRAENDWLGQQASRLSWTTPFTEVLNGVGVSFAKWMTAANVALQLYVVEAGHGDGVAITGKASPVGAR